MSKAIHFLLSSLGSVLIGSVIKWVFGGAIGIVSYAVVMKLFERYINYAIAELTAIDGFAYFMNISRIDEAISVIIGAMTVRASLLAMTVKIATDGG